MASETFTLVCKKCTGSTLKINYNLQSLAGCRLFPGAGERILDDDAWAGPHTLSSSSYLRSSSLHGPAVPVLTVSAKQPTCVVVAWARRTYRSFSVLVARVHESSSQCKQNLDQKQQSPSTEQSLWCRKQKLKNRATPTIQIASISSIF